MIESYRLRVSITICLSIFLLVSWSPTIIQTISGDSAYTYAYHEMFSVGAVHGRDVIHTGGPWSILYYNEFHPNTFWVMIVGQLTIAVIIGWALAAIAHSYICNPKIEWLFLIGTLVLLTSAVDARFFVMGCLIAILTPNIEKNNQTLLFLALLLFAACAMSIKNTFFVMGIILLVQIFLTEIFHLRQFPKYGFLFLLTALAFHSAGGQPLDALPDYIVSLFDMASASSEFLAEGGSVWEWLCYVFLLVLLLFLCLKTNIQRHGILGLIPLSSLAAILFLSYKSGFVRQDGQHVIRAFSVLVPLLVIYHFMNSNNLSPLTSRLGYFRQGMRPQRFWAIGLIFLIGCMSICTALLLNRHPTLYSNKLERLGQQVNGLASILSTGMKTLVRKHESAKAEIRRQFPIADVQGTLAIYSSLQTVGLSYAGYEILPIAAAQMNWTPRLDTKLESFFTGSSAPEFVLGQTPFTARKAGIALLTHYESVGVFNDHYLLRRAEKPRIAKKVFLEDRRWRWDKKLVVPKISDGVLHARISYERTILGSLFSLLYQPPAIVLQLYDHEKLLRQITVGLSIAKSGLPLYPGRPAATDFLLLSRELRGLVRQQKSRSRKITHMSLQFKDANHWLYKNSRLHWFFQPRVNVQFEKLVLTRR